MVGNRARTIVDLMVENNYKIMAEIGVLKSAMLKKVGLLDVDNQIEEYWAIDCWALQPDNPPYSVTPIDYWDMLYKRACSFMTLYKSVKVLRMDSREAAKMFEEKRDRHYFKDGYFDLVFIDANHNKEEVLKDIEAWLPLIKKGGIICGHDYPSSQWLGVQEAVDEYFGVENVELHPGVVWLVRV